MTEDFKSWVEEVSPNLYGVNEKFSFVAGLVQQYNDKTSDKVLAMVAASNKVKQELEGDEYTTLAFEMVMFKK